MRKAIFNVGSSSQSGRNGQGGASPASGLAGASKHGIWWTAGAPDSPPLTVRWSKFRGPGTVNFANNKPAVEKADGKWKTTPVFSSKATTTATFSGARRVRVARGLQRLFRGRRRIPVLLDECSGEGVGQARRDERPILTLPKIKTPKKNETYQDLVKSNHQIPGLTDTFELSGTGLRPVSSIVGAKKGSL